MPSYYQDQNFLNTTYALDISLEAHFSSFLFPLEETSTERIVYADNSYALRRRAELEHRKGNNTNLNLPFMNYKLTSYDFGQQDWWNNEAFSRGIFLDDIGIKVRISPVLLEYEATFWSHRDDEIRYAYTELRFDADTKTTVNSSIEINSQEVPFVGQLGYTGLAFDPTYTESDWLERNKIHSIALDFEVVTFMMKANAEIAIPETVILEFNTLHGLEQTATREETLEAIIDHFSDTVGEFSATS